jgi:hypothetical protein
MQISCPALVFFSGHFANPGRDILLKNMPSLENAAIIFYGETCDMPTLSYFETFFQMHQLEIKLLCYPRLKVHYFLISMKFIIRIFF